MKRLPAIDITRGLVIVIMALDHVRDLLHTNAVVNNPLDLATTSVPLFFTRWITHLCAPIFVFLAGASAYFTVKKQNDRVASSRFFLTRGLWLLLLELTVVNIGIWGNIIYSTVLLQVIYAIGLSFVVLSLLIRLSANTLGFIGLAIILLHNLIPSVDLSAHPVLNVFNGLLLQSNVFFIGQQHAIIAGYPLIPWLGIMLAGFGFAHLFERPVQQQQKALLLIGTAVLLFFILLRYSNFYGDPVQWTVQASPVKTFLSFINVNKYPPSLLYTSCMLGIMCFLLFCAGKWPQSWLAKKLQVYGQVPLFFYLIHWYLVHSIMYIVIIAQGIGWSQMNFGPFSLGRPAVGVGLRLPYVYLVWLAVVLVMYPLCKWYSGYKAANRHKKWLSYL